MGANAALNIGPSKGTMHVIFAALKTVFVFAPCVESEPTRSKNVMWSSKCRIP